MKRVEERGARAAKNVRISRHTMPYFGGVVVIAQARGRNAVTGL